MIYFFKIKKKKKISMGLSQTVQYLDKWLLIHLFVNVVINFQGSQQEQHVSFEQNLLTDPIMIFCGISAGQIPGITILTRHHELFIAKMNRLRIRKVHDGILDKRSWVARLVIILTLSSVVLLQ